jgi:RNA polymerase sigma factor (sigma-70 family)
MRHPWQKFRAFFPLYAWFVSAIFAGEAIGFAPPRAARTFTMTVAHTTQSLSVATDEPDSVARSLGRDDELVAAVVRGDASVAARLYDLLRPCIEHVLRRALQARGQDFEDLIQITFERLVRSIVEGRFQHRSRLTTWAAAVAEHVAIDSLRRTVRERRIFAHADWVAEGSSLRSSLRSDEQLEARSEVRRLQGILARMKPELAEILVQYDVVGHAMEDIAKGKGINLHTAQSRLRRARLEFLRRAEADVPAPADNLVALGGGEG